MWNTVPEEALGDGSLLKALRIRNVLTTTTSELAVNGLFYAIGHIPNTAFLGSQITLDEDVRLAPSRSPAVGPHAASRLTL